MLRSISKQSGGIHVVGHEKEKKATVGRTCRKGRFQVWNERVRG